MDYTGLLNEKENQIVELEKKIQNLEERLRRASRREKELEDEIVRLHSALKTMDRPNVSRVDIEKCLQITTESRGALENLERLQGQLVAFASLCKVQFDKLRADGVRMEFEHDMNALLKAAAGSNFSGVISRVGGIGGIEGEFC